MSEKIKLDESLGLWPKEKPVPEGYKRCSKCGTAKLIGMFNKDKRRPDGHGYQCKACQKARSKDNYKKHAQKKRHVSNYQKNKEQRREYARERYSEKSEEILAQQKEYHKSKGGKAVLKKAHDKRANAIKNNKGIPYTKFDIIKRDSVELENPVSGEMDNYPVCGICGLPIFDLSDLHLDHIVPIAEGGKDCRDNMRCTHSKCNLKRPRKFDTEDRVIK